MEKSWHNKYTERNELGEQKKISSNDSIKLAWKKNVDSSDLCLIMSVKKSIFDKQTVCWEKVEMWRK